MISGVLRLNGEKMMVPWSTGALRMSTTPVSIMEPELCMDM